MISYFPTSSNVLNTTYLFNLGMFYLSFLSPSPLPLSLIFIKRYIKILCESPYLKQVRKSGFYAYFSNPDLTLLFCILLI
jgi:hypothetical protein